MPMQDAAPRPEERATVVSALRPFFHPRSVAVIGASRQRGTIGGEIFHNLLDFGFNGAIYPVNASASVVQSVAAYRTIEDVPGDVDLAIVVVPASHVMDVVHACARKGVRALVVISAGFAETGDDGRALQHELVRAVRRAGMRLIGPNCMGILNTAKDVRLHATFAPVVPLEGRVAFMSQSGALGLAVMEYASQYGLGLSTFVSVGNKADISGNDLIQYWDQDPKTDLILLYLESFGNPRKFSRIAREVARRKPIVAVKSGRSPAGARATGSHTGALIAASDVTVDALFHQTGVIRTDTLEQMFDVAALLATQPLPAGRRVAILTNAGGPGILCADACAAEGLELPSFADDTQAALRALLPPEASIRNPVDMIAAATADQYREAISLVGRDPNVDAIVVIFIPPLVTRSDDVARAIVDGAHALGGSKPILSVFMQARGVPAALRSDRAHIPSYAFPENAAIALARAASYRAWRETPPTSPARFDDVRREEARALLDAAIARGDEWLSASDVWSLLACYGLPTLPQCSAITPDEVERAATSLVTSGGKLALKAVAPGLVHKTDVGAVQLNLAPQEMRAAAIAMTQRLRAAGHDVTEFIVQPMAAPGVEMIVGVVHDPQFGPVVACGAGGALVELLADVSLRLAPLSARDADEMLHELKSFKRLVGYRGSAPTDVPALEDAVLRVSAMADALPQIAELDLNPILVHERGVTIVDARVRLTRHTG